MPVDSPASNAVVVMFKIDAVNVVPLNTPKRGIGVGVEPLPEPEPLPDPDPLPEPEPGADTNVTSSPPHAARAKENAATAIQRLSCIFI